MDKKLHDIEAMKMMNVPILSKEQAEKFMKDLIIGPCFNVKESHTIDGVRVIDKIDLKSFSLSSK